VVEGRMLIIRMRTIKRKESDGVLAGEFAKNVITADLTARVERNQTARFDPENSHVA
jgi:hypothetical protein